MSAIEGVFVDTNLFLRYLTNDIPQRADAFEQVLLRAAQGQVKLVTNALVIAEIIWTLGSFYQRSKADIQRLILAILNTPGLQIVEGEIILQAILWYTEKNVDFIDAFNAAWMLHYEIDTAYTFDRKHFSRFEGIKVLDIGRLV